MSREDRLQQMQRLFRSRRSLSMQQLMDELQVGRATVTRYLGYLKDTFGIPIEWDGELRGYRVVGGEGSSSGLMGLWFSPAELHALLTMEQLIRRIEPGFLRSHIEPLRERLRKLLGSETHPLDEIEKRIRVLPMRARSVDPKIFQAVLTALLNRQRLKISYESRTDGTISHRTISPQRMAHYRDNWYLDAWCHVKRSLRMFSVDAITKATVLDHRARDLPEEKLRAILESGYGIFSGRRTLVARLRFSRARAGLVAKESWHPNQQGKLDAKGRYLLNFPYSNHLELVMDLLRHIPEVEVLGPKSLRNYLNDRIKSAAARLA